MTAAPLPSLRRDAFTTLALIAAWLLASAWLRPLMVPDEGRYAGVAWEMLRSGDWLTPTLNGLPFFHKPPLFYWLSGAALWLFGLVEIAGRAGALCGATLGAWALYLFARRWGGPAAARRALWVLLVQPLWLVGGQFANLDMLVAGCITATWLALAHAALCFEQGLAYRRWLWLGYALAGLGVLAKGLIGFVIPALCIGLWLLLRGRWRTLLALFSLPGALLFLLIAGPWYLAMQQRFDGFLHYFFVVQHFQRFSVGGFNNAMPLWFYPAVLALLSLPCLLWSARLLTRRYWAQTGGSPEAAVRLAMLVAVASVLLFFSIPKSKLVGYVLPAVPPLAWLMADASALLAGTRARRNAWRASAALSAALGLAAVLWLTLHTDYSSRPLALALRAEHQDNEPVYMLDEYLYDLPFYAQLRQPVRVVSHWRSPEAKARDNWRKELDDAADFNPGAGQRLLLRPEDFEAALCAAPRSWVLAEPAELARYPVLAQATPVLTSHGTTLVRVDAARDCAKTPNGG